MPPVETWARLSADEADSLAWELTLRGVRGEAPPAARTWLGEQCSAEAAGRRTADACRALGTLRPPATAALLDRLRTSPAEGPTVTGAVSGLLAAATLSPGSRSIAIPGAIDLLDEASVTPAVRAGAHRYLVEVSAQDLGQLPAPWRQWWQRTTETLRRLGDR